MSQQGPSVPPEARPEVGGNGPLVRLLEGVRQIEEVEAARDQ